MKIQTLKIFAILVLIGLVTCQQTPALVQDATKGVQIPKYVLNLDLPYEQRWKDIVLAYKQPIQNFWKYLESLPNIKKFTLPLYENTDFLEEIKAISDIAGVSFQTSQIVSQMYELVDSFGCTSLIARNLQGQIFHSRNLDFAFAEYITTLLAQVEFQKGGKTLYFADVVVGTVITPTGIKPNSYSITVNARDDANSIDNLKAQLIPPNYLLHKIFQTQTTYEGALEQLKTTQLASNVYFIIAGISGNQGTVLERNKDSVNKETSLSDTNWFVCQTNYDRDIPDPEDDRRRIPCEERLQRLNQNFSEMDLSKLLNEKPVFAVDTISTNIFIPKTGLYTSTKWFNAKTLIDSSENKSFSEKIVLGLTTLLILFSLL